MEKLRELEEVLTAAKKIGEKFQDELSKLQTEKNLLAEENAELRATNQKILAERTGMLIEMNNLLAENDRLRKVNEMFGKNFQQLPQQLHFIMQNEFQKFLTAATSSGEKNFDEDENLIVPTDEEFEILDAEEKLPANLNQPKKKMVYAEFYAEELGFEKD